MPEVGHAVHEHQQRRGDGRGRDQRHDHGKDLADGVAAQAFGRLAYGHVHLFERAADVHVDEGIQLERKDQQHAAKAVDGRHFDAEGIGKELGDHAAAAQKQNPRVCADEVGAHHGDDDEDLNDALAPDLEKGHDVGQRHADEQRADGDAHRELEGVEQRPVVEFLSKELGEIGHGEGARALFQKAVHEQGDERIDQKQGEHGKNADGYDRPEIELRLTLAHSESHP